MKIHVQVPLWNVTYKIEKLEDELGYEWAIWGNVDGNEQARELLGVGQELDPTQDSFPVEALKALEEALANLGLIFVVFSE